MADLISMLVAAYVGIGVIVGLVMVTVGVGRIDDAARGGPWHSRVLIFPGCVLLWPVMLMKIFCAGKGRDDA